MPLFIATHKWGKEDTQTVMKKVILEKACRTHITLYPYNARDNGDILPHF